MIKSFPATATKVLLPKVTPLNEFAVPELRLVHVIPSGVVMTTPEIPAATKVLFPKATPLSEFDVPELWLVHVIPSEDVMTVP
jgi:hypothetical protein